MSSIRVFYQNVSLADLDISDKDIIHKLKDVLRLAPGEQVFLFNGAGKEYSFIIEEISKKRLLLKAGGLNREEGEPLKKVILAYPVIKEERIDFILQKSTELGVWRFQPFFCRHSLFKQASDKKYQRWQKIVNEATRQSGRLWRPLVSPPLSFDDLITVDFPRRFAAAIDGAAAGEIDFPKAGEVLLVIGPEGDFSPEEYELFKQNNFQFIKLCDTLLRVETAAIFAAGLAVNIL
jgi:16S rRNA (uracil1498-N3)-methyltransferase